MTLLDIRSWTKRNIWRRPTGDLCARPGLRRLSTLSGRRTVAGHSVANPWTFEVWHYIADTDANGKDLTIRIYDEDFVEWQAYSTGVDGVPRGFSVAVVDQEVLICSPDMPTLYGLVGSGLVLATKVASDNPNTTALPIPRGIAATICNRAVIAEGSTLYISDPTAITGGTIRTFVGQNVNARPGVIFGVHEGAGGALVAVTSAGVYVLDSAAFAVGVVGSNGADWRLANHHQSYSYDSSCAVRGRIYALTQRGYALVDVENDEEALLDDPLQPRFYGPRVSSSDWRAARLYSGDDGPLVGYGGRLNVANLTDGLKSWWDSDVSADFSVCGVLRDQDGGLMLLSADGVYQIGGNYDGIFTSGASGSTTRAVLAGPVPSPPQINQTLRSATWRVGVGGDGEVTFAVRGQQVVSGTPPADSRGVVSAVNSWGDTGIVYQPTPLSRLDESVNFDFNSGDLTMELTTTVQNARVGEVLEYQISESATARKTDRGAP
jgi:hypothetical protein